MNVQIAASTDGRDLPCFEAGPQHLTTVHMGHLRRGPAGQDGRPIRSAHPVQAVPSAVPRTHHAAAPSTAGTDGPYGHRLDPAQARLPDDERWHAGEDIAFPSPHGPYDTAPDGSDLLEILLDDIVDRYVKFAEDYHEIEVDPTAVEHVVAHRPLTDVVVQALNPEESVAGLYEDIAAIGYPIVAS